MGAPILGAIPLPSIRAYLDEIGCRDAILRWRYISVIGALDAEERRLILADFNKRAKRAEANQQQRVPRHSEMRTLGS